jgi:DNA-binding response OmpR family regulator
MRILIVEDEEAIVRFLELGLAAHGHSVVSADNGEEGAQLATDETVEFVVLDIRLPGIDGHEVLKRIRAERPNLPVLMLTARDDLENKVSALNEGADDYLTKPFAFEELLARIRALSRRADQVTAAQLESGDLRMDLLSRRVWRGERLVELSSREFALLECLMRHPGQVLARQQILSTVWDYTFDPGTNIVDVYVRYLRRKIDRPGEASLIHTIRGVGYRFNAHPAS